MLDEITRTKLRDPDYFALHCQAIAAMREVGDFAWYDSNFLRRFETAKLYLRTVRPDALSEFIQEFDALLPPDGFQPIRMTEVFDETTQNKIQEIARCATVPHSSQEKFEAENFGRQVVWDQPFLSELQKSLAPHVSDLVGLPLAVGYNFLSLYGDDGKCDPHMDEPYSMFTLDYCIEQNVEWPIYFSKIVDWPTVETKGTFDKEAIKQDTSLNFSPRILKPNEALIFNGSSQWHYRDKIQEGGFCSLLFFHYYPEGCDDLVRPKRWGEHFKIAELGPLCDLL